MCSRERVLSVDTLNTKLTNFGQTTGNSNTMKRKDKKKQDIKFRDRGVIVMLAHTKPGAMTDRKKQASKKACRKKVKHEDS